MKKTPTLTLVTLLSLAPFSWSKEHLDDPGVQVVSPGQVVRGTVVDPRNRTKYATVRIGTQTWMAENLDYKTGNSWCYGNDPDNCEKWGRLYDWQTARTACPSGWHLPSDDEWRVLEKTVGGKETGGTKLKSTSGWSYNGNGTDSYGFTVLPAGYRSDVGRFDNVGDIACFWSASETVGGNAWIRYFGNGYASVIRYVDNKTYGSSVRCLEN